MTDAATSSEEIDTLRDGQEIGLYVLTMISATISIVGSSTIVYKVVKNLHTALPYDRFLLGLSSCDIVASLTFFVAPFMLPKATSQRVWASGNEGTCTALGFLTQFSYSAFVYNGMLSFYYLLTVRYGVKRQTLAKKYEPWMHISVVGFFLATASIGAAIGLYNEIDLGPGCWIRDYPRGCYEVGGCTGHYFGWVFTGLPTLFTLFSVIVNNLVIYFHVKRIFGASDNSNAPGAAVFQRRTSMRHKEQIRDVARQGLLYVGSFFLCYSCQFVLRVLESSPFPADEKEGQVYWLLLLDAFLRPLQGFVNLLVYTRPNYVKLREAFPEMSKKWALRKAFTSPDIPKLISSSRHSTRHSGSRTGRHRPEGSSGSFGSGGNRNNTVKSHKSGSYVSDLFVVSERSNESESDNERSHERGGETIPVAKLVENAKSSKSRPQQSKAPLFDDPLSTVTTARGESFGLESSRDSQGEVLSSNGISMLSEHEKPSSSARLGMDGTLHEGDIDTHGRESFGHE